MAGGELLGRRLLARLRLLRHTRRGRVVRHRAAQHLHLLCEQQVAELDAQVGHVGARDGIATLAWLRVVGT